MKIFIDMIKLVDLLESSHRDVVYLFEFPLKISPIDFDPNKLNAVGRNSTFTMAVKQSAKLIDKISEFDVYEYVIDGYTTNVLIKDDNTHAFFMYRVNNNIAIEEKVWQDPICIGLCRQFIFDYILKKYDGLISDDAHTELGQKYWDKLLKQALSLGYKIYVMYKDKKMPLSNDVDIDTYYSNSIKSTEYRFLIEK